MKEMQEFEKVERWWTEPGDLFQSGLELHHEAMVKYSDYDALLVYAKELHKKLEELDKSFSDSIEARSRGL
jgi:hypothetical protein